MAQVFVVKNGTLIPKQNICQQLSKPAIVTYQHTIRRIQDKSCQCHWQISQLKLDHQKEIKLKNKEISALLKRIIQKDQQIQNFKQNIASLQKNKILRGLNSNNHILQDITNQEIPFLNDKFQENGLNETTTSVLNSSVQSSYRRFGIQKKQIQMQDCFRRTDNLMNQIQQMMKNTKKYEFYNKFSKKESIIMEEPELKSQKSLDETDEIFFLQDTIYLPNGQYEFDEDSFTDVSNCQFKINQHNFSNDQQFFEKTIQETINLKNSLEEFKRESAIELQTVQQLYKKEIMKLQQKLKKQRRKNQLFELTKDKINKLSDRGKQTLNQLQESFQFDIPFHFQNFKNKQFDSKDGIQLLMEES